MPVTDEIEASRIRGRLGEDGVHARALADATVSYIPSRAVILPSRSLTTSVKSMTSVGVSHAGSVCLVYGGGRGLD
jgi:hypothetical protein